MATPQPKARRRAQQLGAGRQSRARRASRTVSAAAWARPASADVELDPDQVREGRVAKRPAALELAGQEARGVVGRGVADRRGVGRQRLDEHPPAALAAAAAPGELGDQREGPLLGAEVGEAQRRVGVQHDAQHDVGEVVSLGDHLRADQDARTAPARSAAGSRHGLPARAALSESSRKTGSGATASSSRVARRSVPAPWRARATEPQSGQDVGDGLGVAAVVADAGAPARWWRTSETSQCGHSQARPQERQREERRPAAPVEEHDRLAARLAAPRRAPRRCAVGVASAARRPRASAPAVSTTSTCGRSPPVDARAAARSAWQRQPALGPRRGAAGDQRRAGLGRPPPGDLARVVARVALLLVGGVVLLVDHDQAQVARPARRPPSAGRRRSAPRRPAGAATRRGARRAASREWSSATRSPKRDANRDTSAASARSPGRARSRPCPAERRLGGGEVDLGLARAGDAVQEELAARRRRRSRRRSPSSAARCSARQPRSRATGRRRRRPPAAGSARGRCAALTRPRASRRPRACRSAPPSVSSSPGRELGAGRPSPASASSAARWRAPERRPVAKRRPAGLGGGGERARAAARVPARRDPTPGGSTSSSPRAGVEQYSRATQRPEPDELRRGPRLQRLDRLREPLRRQLARLGDLDHDAEHPPAPERDQEDAADADLAEPLGQEVVERPPQRAGGGQRLDLRDRHPGDARDGGGRRTARRRWPAGLLGRAPVALMLRRGAEARTGGAGDVPGPSVVAVDHRLLRQGAVRGADRGFVVGLVTNIIGDDTDAGLVTLVAVVGVAVSSWPGSSSGSPTTTRSPPAACTSSAGSSRERSRRRAWSGSRT